MRNMTKRNAEELVKAFRKAAKELDCNLSEQRFQEVLFAIGTHKPVRRSSRRAKFSRKVTPRRSQ
jgi:hypothetical protein